MPTKTVEVHHGDFDRETGKLVGQTHVATVEVDASLETAAALEEAWLRTQNIRGSWSMGPRFEDDGEVNPDHHPSVTRHAPLHEVDGQTYGLRSSMVGDIFIIGDEKFRAAMIGFEPA